MACRFITDSVELRHVRLPPIQRKPGKVGSKQETMGLAAREMLYFPKLPNINGDILRSKIRVESTRAIGGNTAALKSGVDKLLPQLSLSAPQENARMPFKEATRVTTLKQSEKFNTSPDTRKQNGPRIKRRFQQAEASRDHGGVVDTVRLTGLRLRRRFNASKLYQRDGQPTHQEILNIDQNMDKLHTFSARDKQMELKDLNGRNVQSDKVFKDDITSYVAMFEAHEKSTLSACPEETNGSQEEAKKRIQGRFFEALDLHFYHYYRNTNPDRRMAICEEIERTIVVDNVALTWYREHLRLQEILDVWML